MTDENNRGVRLTDERRGVVPGMDAASCEERMRAEQDSSRYRDPAWLRQQAANTKLPERVRDALRSVADDMDWLRERLAGNEPVEAAFSEHDIKLLRHAAAWARSDIGECDPKRMKEAGDAVLRAADRLAALRETRPVGRVQKDTGGNLYAMLLPPPNDVPLAPGSPLYAAPGSPAWFAPADAPISNSADPRYFLAVCPDDPWGVGGTTHFAVRYEYFPDGYCRPMGTSGERRFTKWMPVPT